MSEESVCEKCRCGAPPSGKKFCDGWFAECGSLISPFGPNQYLPTTECLTAQLAAANAEIERLRADLKHETDRVSILEQELGSAAATLQLHLPVGRVKAIGLREVAAGVEQLAAQADAGERLRESCRDAVVDLEQLAVDVREAGTLIIGSAVARKASEIARSLAALDAQGE